MQRRHVLVIGLSVLMALAGAFAMAGGVTAQSATATATPTATATSTPTPTATATPQPDLVAIYRADIDARNRGDVAALLSLYTDDSVQVGGTTCPCVGKAAVQSQAEIAVGLHTQRTVVGNPQVSGNVLTSREEHRNDRFRELGFDRTINNLTYTFIGNKIARRVIEDDLTDVQTAASAARQAAPRPGAPPKTGNAGLATGSSMAVQIALGSVALLTIAGGFAARRRMR